MSTAMLLHIELRDLTPKISREVLVSPGITLRKLHDILQSAMGWDDSHLYGFATPQGNQRYWRVEAQNRYEPTSDGTYDEPSNSVDEFKVSDVLINPKDKLLYMYDFGDDWEHKITFKKIIETDEPLPQLVKAQNGCPPENCGGFSGFIYWAQIWHDKKHPEYETAWEVFGGREPGKLDLARLQKDVARYQAKPKRPAKTWVKVDK